MSLMRKSMEMYRRKIKHTIKQEEREKKEGIYKI